MEKPLITLKSKDFLTGLSTGAHIGSGGLFFKADGITPLYEAGSAQSVNNGLLMAGASGTQITGNLNGTVISGASYTSASNTTFYFGTSTGHIFSLVADTGFATSLTDAHTATSLRQGFDRLTDTSGAEWLFYFMDTAIGSFNLNATWNDTWASGLSSDDRHASHKYFDRILFGNSGYVGYIQANSDLSTSGAGNLNKTALNITSKGVCTDISDDGIYAVIATTKNISCDTNAMAGCTILFWDCYSTTWLREYSIPDPFIFALEHTPLGVFAFGVTGVWQVSFGQEPVKVFHTPTGIYSVNTSGALQYGRPTISHYGNALLWGGTSGSNKTVKTLGKLDGNAPNAYLHPFLSTASKNITYVDGQLLKGYVLVGDDTPLLKAYPFSTANSPATGLTAQTAYISLPTKFEINWINLVFGEPLASGDSVSIGVYRDEDTAVTSVGTASYSTDGAIRRKALDCSVKCEDQMSLLLTFTAGAVKIKAIEVYGTPMEPKTE